MPRKQVNKEIRERYLKTTWGKRYINNRVKNYLEE
jgi:hypothetical protein